MEATWLVPIVAGALTLLGTLAVNRWQRSGSVRTSEAGDLWDAQSGFLKDVLERLTKAEGELEACRERDRQKDQKILDLEREVDRLREGLHAVTRKVENGNGDSKGGSL